MAIMRIRRKGKKGFKFKKVAISKNKRCCYNCEEFEQEDVYSAKHGRIYLLNNNETLKRQTKKKDGGCFKWDSEKGRNYTFVFLNDCCQYFTPKKE